MLGRERRPVTGAIDGAEDGLKEGVEAADDLLGELREHGGVVCVGAHEAQALGGLGDELGFEAARALRAHLLCDAVVVRDTDVGALELVHGKGGAGATVEKLPLEADLDLFTFLGLALVSVRETPLSESLKSMVSTRTPARTWKRSCSAIWSMTYGAAMMARESPDCPNCGINAGGPGVGVPGSSNGTFGKKPTSSVKTSVWRASSKPTNKLWLMDPV